MLKLAYDSSTTINFTVGSILTDGNERQPTGYNLEYINVD